MKKEFLLYFLLFSVFLLISYIIGSRDSSVGADTLNYLIHYKNAVQCKCIQHHEIGYEILVLLFAVPGFDPIIYFTAVSFIVFGISLHLAIETKGYMFNYERVSKRMSAVLVILSMFLLNPLFLQIHINGIRQGISALILCLSFVYLLRERYFLSYLIYILSVLFHTSALMYLPAFFVFRRNGSFHFVVIIYIAFLFLYLTGATKYIVSVLFPYLYNFVANYGYSAAERYQAGVRVDFSLFTTAVALAGLALIKMGKGEKKGLYQIWSLAIICTIPFFILGWGVFSNRYLFTSWILLGYVMAACLIPYIATLKQSSFASLVLFVCSIAFFLNKFNFSSAG